MTFDDWLQQDDGQHKRVERLYEDLEKIENFNKQTEDKLFDKIRVLTWLRTAYDVGFDEGKKC